jgi:molybdenum cofactor cytidylyltransferase
MIGAVVLAAGQSRRMGRNKLMLPYGAATVIETVVARVLACPAVGEVVVVIGHEPDRLAALLKPYPVRCVFNPAYDRAEMLVSLQTGLRALSAEASAALLVLGDQPRLQGALVQRVIAALQPGGIVIPSFQMKRGHPIGLARSLWDEVLALPDTATLRDFLRAHEAHICHVLAEDDSVLKDVDTPEDYQALLNG